VLLPSFAQAAIFGDGNPENGIEDQRLVLSLEQQSLPESNAMAAVGTVICDGGLRGTATHVKSPSTDANQSIIVTAAHILFDVKSGKEYASCSYLPKNKRLSAISFGTISEHSFDPLNRDKIAQSENDIVFVALSRALQQPALLLSVPQAINKGKLSLLGYNSSQNHLTESADCKQYGSIQFASEKLLLHDCDARSGASGGPLLWRGENDQPATLIAVHGGTLMVKGVGEAASKSNSASRDGAEADPERWINQARRVDPAVLERLRRFIAYLAKGSQDQR
jgi:V8-like Glu-specific endopeptidase